MASSGCKKPRFSAPTWCCSTSDCPDSAVVVLKRLREWSDVPVLILSVRDQETVKVEALELGADDYVTKPFGTAKLLARLDVIQRRRFTRQSPEIVAGALKLDLLHHEATFAEDPIKLTAHRVRITQSPRRAPRAAS